MGVATAGLKAIIDKLIKLKGGFDLAKFSQSLPEDLQSLLSEIYLTPEYVTALEEMKIEKEWQNSFKNLQDLNVTTKATQITKELDVLDSKKEKTAQDEARQAELLRQIVLLKKKS